MRIEDAPEIRKLPLFRTMSRDAVAALLRGARFRTFPPGVELIREGDRPDFLHILVRGEVELFARWTRRQTAVSTPTPVAAFVLAATVTDRPYLTSARTVARSRIVLVPSEDVRGALASDAGFARAIVAELAADCRDAVRNVKNLKLRTSVERLANYLLREQQAAGGVTGFALPHEKRLVASLLGMTPESLSRAFGTLRSHGVEVTGAHVEIAAPDALRALARPSPLIDDPAG